jgi:hypothetical protein
MASGLLIDYLGHGNIADRPTTPNLFTGSVGIWWSDDTTELSLWDGAAWQEDIGGGGTGDVVGPASAVDGNIATYDGTTGKLIEDGGATIAEVRSIPQNSQSAAYTLVLADAGKHIYHPSADTTARIWTIPANGTVAFPIGTAVTFINDTSAGTVTIAITTDTLVLMGAGSTGSRTLAAGGIATAVKVTSTRWVISGVNLT